MTRRRSKNYFPLVARLRKGGFGELESLESRWLLAAPDGSGFTTELVASGLDQPVAFDTAPDGRLFVTEKSGRVQIVDDGQIVGQFIDLTDEVASDGDRGLIGIALDPGFSTNGHVYLNYTVKGSDPQCSPPSGLPFGVTACGQVVRVTVSASDPNVADLASRAVVLGGHILAQAHSVGDIDFDAGGNLIFSWGDGGFEPSLRLYAQDPDSVQGKIFRVDPTTFEGVPSNPFFDSTSPGDVRSKVWAIGVRNSWRISVDEPTGDVYFGEVTDQGPEEINVIRANGITEPLNFGWPYFEDDVPTSYAQPPSGFVYQRALTSFAHSGLPGGDAITAGAIYHGAAYPAEYSGRFFFGNFPQSTLYTADQAGNYQQFGTYGQYPFPIDVQLGDDEHIYFMSLVSS